MSEGRRGRARAKQFLGGIGVIMIVALQASGSGVPATWRLRRLARSKDVRQACADTGEQLRARLAAIGRTYGLRPVLSQTIDHCTRASRVNLLPNHATRSGASMTGHLRITAYFAPEASVERAVPELIERLPPRLLYRDTYAPKPEPDSPGPHTALDGDDHVTVDWDIPGERLMTLWAPSRNDRHTVWQQSSTEPPGLPLEQVRQVHGPLIAWTLSATYYAH
ncbi:hypothetical protein ACIQWA_37535 [Kitasatospora sp. NPDC098652]|uniref:hypothetical protein n=1 Tax=Kitasatospora sp. NPDC098652 TaxID=3364095 RepID=UPI00382E2E6B